MTPQVFIEKWDGKDGSERANYQMFFNDLCELLEVGKPQPSQANDWENRYVFERYIEANDGSSAGNSRFIDTYLSGKFICESKSFNEGRNSRTTEARLIAAKAQAESYARNLPTSEPRPPFLMVINVGRFIALYAQFRSDDRNYMLFPDRMSYRMSIQDLAREDIRQRLRQIWLDPNALNPELISAEVTQTVAIPLGQLARQLEDAGQEPQRVAGFLTRCLFSMFAEDIGLLPAGAFTLLLERALPSPFLLAPNLSELWRAMDQGGVSVALQIQVAHFNGKLFKAPEAFPLTRPQIEILLDAARQDWRHVEPAIFGTLIERALDPEERHALGAHFTPRAYVERLVLPTVIEPLRARWDNVRAAALALEDANHRDAVALVRDFYGRLCQTRVLDPACGSGNFLYIALEYMKRLEGEVLEQLDALGVSETLDTQGLTVDPHQFIGLELNPRAAAVAELVLWIGYLQWHFRTKGKASPPSPVLKDFKNIIAGDAMLRYVGKEAALDAQGRPLTRWDGKTLKTHPATGQEVPDETAQVPVERYLAPERVIWPKASYVVGNPPFIGNKRLREALGDGYVEALRAAHPEVPESADLVMYWWDQAAGLLAGGEIERFGFITTNSLTQTFNRRVLENHLGEKLSLVFAIPDHPWVDSSDGAAVRVAMTVAAPGQSEGRLQKVLIESPAGNGEVNVTLAQKIGLIHSDLSTGADVTSALPLKANEGLSNRGVIPHGEGFLVTREEGAKLDGGALLKDYRNGKDLTDRPRGVRVIDTFGLDEPSLRSLYPASWQWLHDRVKPDRDQNPRKSRRENWWLFGENQPRTRASILGLSRYIATGQTAKHRIFQFLDGAILPDDKLIAVALDDAYFLGVLSSQAHVCWALAAGGWMGVGNDPVYNKSKCFDAFPFPAASEPQQARIRQLAEELDAQRKRVLAEHGGLTLTGLYNVLEALRAGRLLTAKEKVIHQQGLVSVLKTLHDELDAAVFQAYGWNDLLVGSAVGWAKAEGRAHAGGGHPALCPPYETVVGPDLSGHGGMNPAPQDTLLERLVALNRKRREEEAAGQVRWLRPEFQVREAAESGKKKPAQAAAPTETQETPEVEAGKIPWPEDVPSRYGAVSLLLKHSAQALTAKEISAQFVGEGRVKGVPPILETLERLALVRQIEPGKFVAC